MAISGMGFMYKRVVQTLSKKVEDRQKYELLALEEWFRKKSNILKEVRLGKLLSVHCEGIFLAQVHLLE